MVSAPKLKKLANWQNPHKSCVGLNGAAVPLFASEEEEQDGVRVEVEGEGEGEGRETRGRYAKRAER